MEKKYWNKGAFMTGLNTMIVADEQRLDEIADPVIREAVRKQLEVKLPVHPDKVLIKMECVGVCGSDVHYFHEGQCGTFFLDPGRDIPYMLGHEAAGTVVEVGANVTGLSVGDRVCCEPGKACGKCEMCRAGKYNLCRDVIFWATPPVQGCYMRYVEFYADLCFRIPDSMSMEAGAMVEPFATAMFAAETAEVQKGDSVLIMGSGCIGLMTLLACRYKGAENVILCDLEAAGRDRGHRQRGHHPPVRRARPQRRGRGPAGHAAGGRHPLQHQRHHGQRGPDPPDLPLPVYFPRMHQGGLDLLPD